MKSRSEIEAEAKLVNSLPREPDGSYRWKCEICGKELKREPLEADPSYDRSKDHSNWPVMCEDCSIL